MAYLLDTHIALWLSYEPQKITHEVEQILLDKKHKVYFSTINIWEVAIKSKLGKFDYIGVNAKALNQALLVGGFEEIPVVSRHCFTLENLPKIHTDPFDRLLISQAMTEDFTLITHDGKILQYENLKTLRA